MRPSRTRSGRWDVHQETIAVASVAKDHDADVLSIGTLGTRQADLAQLVRPPPSNATPLVLVDEAGPWGPGALVI